MDYSKQRVLEYINQDERTQLIEILNSHYSNLNTLDDFINYATKNYGGHIYYHMLVLVNGKKSALQELEKIWNEEKIHED